MGKRSPARAAPAAAPAPLSKRAKPAQSPKKDDSLLGSFSLLADVHDDVRHAAAIRVVELVCPEDKQADRDYALKRLTRGLASNRPLARQGFALCLIGVLRACATVQTASVLDMLDESTAVHKHDKGDEERDKLLGRAFGLVAIVHAERAGDGCALRIVQGLCVLASKKSWLREFVSGALVHLFEMSKNPIPGLDQALGEFCPLTPGTFDCPAEATLDAEQIAVVVAAQRKWAKKRTWLVLQPERMSALAAPLASAWRADPPRLCLVWQILIDVAIEANVMEAFWDKVVIEALLKGGIASPQRKCAAMLVMSFAAQRLGQASRFDLIPQALLAHDSAAALVALSSSKAKDLQDPAKAALDSIAQALDAKLGMEDSRQEARLATLLRLRGEDLGENRACNQTALKLLAGMNGAVLERYVEQILSSLDKPSNVAALIEVCRVHAERTMDLTRAIFTFGFLPRSTPEGESCRARFSAVLGVAITQSGSALAVLREVAEWWKDGGEVSMDKAARKAARKLHKMESDEAKALETLVLLVALLGLVGDVPDSQELLEDLVVASDKLLASSEAGSEEEEVDPVAVVTDAMLALLSQPSSLVRQVVDEAAKHLAARIVTSQAAVDQICAALMRQVGGANELHAQPQAEDDIEEEEAEEAEEYAHEDEGHFVKDDDDDEAPPQSKKHKAAAAAEEEEGDDADNNEDDEQPNDQGSEDGYDEALAAYLRLRTEASAKSSKQARKRALRNIVSFKLRVLDVVEAVGKVAPAVVPQFVISLLIAAEQSVKGLDGGLGGELLGRVASLFKRLFKGGEADAELAQTIITESITLARKNKGRPLTQLAMDAANYGLRLGAPHDVSMDKATAQAIVGDLIEGRGSCITVKSLAPLLENHPSLSKLMLPVVLRSVPRTPFQQGQVVDLATRMVKLPGVDAAQLLGVIEATIAREVTDLSQSKSNAQRQRDALRVLLAWKKQFSAQAPVMSNELKASLKRLASEAHSAASKQLAEQCLSGA